MWVYLYLFLRNCLRKLRKDVQDEQRASPLSFNVFFLENRANVCTNFILPETRLAAEDLRQDTVMSIIISFQAIIFQKSHCQS